MESIELEYRVEIPIETFDTIAEQFGRSFVLQSHKSRFALMLFFENELSSSILYIRNTIDKKTNMSDAEIVHKKGIFHSCDRLETTQKINSDNFVEYLKLFESMSTQKTLIMQRETLNYTTDSQLTISLVKAKYHAYIEFEKLCNLVNKNDSEKEILDMLEIYHLKALDEAASKDFFSRLDLHDDCVIEVKDSDANIASREYVLFLEQK